MKETQETRVQSLGQEDPLEKGMSTDSSILAWRIPWTEEPGGLQSMGSQRVGHNGVTFTFTCLPILGRGNVPQSDSVSISHKLVLKKKKKAYSYKAYSSILSLLQVLQ